MNYGVQDIEGQVLEVEGRPTARNTIYDIKFSDGNTYSTFKQAIASKAQQLAGQFVSARVEVKQKGEFTNYDLVDIAPQGQLPAMAVPAGTPVMPQTGGFGAPPLAPPINTPLPAPVPIPMHDPSVKDERITRQNVLRTAHDFVGQFFQAAGPEAIPEAREIALNMARELFVIAHYGQPVAPVAEPVTAQEVAAQANAELPGAVQVGAQDW